MRITFLGTGTSTGIPQIACKCKVCSSSDTKDKRLRASVLIETDGKFLLIDCGPDFRQQCLTNDIQHIDAVLVTHEHYDHIGGLDDLRPLGDMTIYAEQRVLKTIERVMPYCFAENKYPGVPRITLQSIDLKPFIIGTNQVIPIRVLHANLPIMGFRIDKLAYITDLKSIDKSEIAKLHNLDLLIINALRLKEHISHVTLSEAIEIAKQINAKQTFFTHMSHDMGLHTEVSNLLPFGMFFAHDGLNIYLD